MVFDGLVAGALMRSGGSEFQREKDSRHHVAKSTKGGTLSVPRMDLRDSTPRRLSARVLVAAARIGWVVFLDDLLSHCGHGSHARSLKY